MNPLPDFHIFFFVAMIVNYSEDTAERSGFPQGIPAELQAIRNTIESLVLLQQLGGF